MRRMSASKEEREMKTDEQGMTSCKEKETKGER
jgi:hypothetical protein